MTIRQCYDCKAVLGVEWWPEHSGRTEVTHGLCQRCFEVEAAVLDGLLQDAQEPTWEPLSRPISPWIDAP